jgi:hypothetical protein
MFLKSGFPAIANETVEAIAIASVSGSVHAAIVSRYRENVMRRVDFDGLILSANLSTRITDALMLLSAGRCCSAIVRDVCACSIAIGWPIDKKNATEAAARRRVNTDSPNALNNSCLSKCRLFHAENDLDQIGSLRMGGFIAGTGRSVVWDTSGASSDCKILAASREMMIQAATIIVGSIATFWATAAASQRGGSLHSSLSGVSKAMAVSLVLSGVMFLIGAAWCFLADSAPFSDANGGRQVLHAWIALVGPVVSLVIVPASYAAATSLQLSRFQLSDRWRFYGFPSLVALIYAALNVMSFVSDRNGGWSQIGLWSYSLLPMHCFAVFASWIVYVGGMDRWAAKN